MRSFPSRLQAGLLLLLLFSILGTTPMPLPQFDSAIIEFGGHLNYPNINS